MLRLSLVSPFIPPPPRERTNLVVAAIYRSLVNLRILLIAVCVCVYVCMCVCVSMLLFIAFCVLRICKDIITFTCDYFHWLLWGEVPHCG